MPNVPLSLTPFQAAVLQRLVNRGFNAQDFIKDRLFTAVAHHLSLGLDAVVGLERAFITAGSGTACGVQLTTGGSQPYTFTCVRLAEHLTDGVAARSSHVAPGPDGSLTSWQEGQT